MTWDEIRAEAFGEIGVNPEDFYWMEFSDYLLLKKGFVNRRNYEQSILRRHVYLTLSAWCKQLPSAYKIWPLPGDEELLKQIRKRDEEIRDTILREHRVGGFEYVDEVRDGRVVIIKKKYLING